MLLEIEGVPVSFPFEPYPCQVDFMRCMIKCLQGGSNGILESPTGTGKTLCLLCSSLAWLETKKAQISSKRWQMAQSFKANQTDGAVEFYEEYTTKLAKDLDSVSGQWAGELGAPKIIYASRTHSQLSQAMNELKRTSYKHFKAGVLGSREQLCIHPQVMKEQNNSTKVHLCRAKVQTRSCFFYNNVENARGTMTQTVVDIEDLVKFGEKQKCCPYYLSREMKTDADILFMPYNYLLDPKSRKAHGVELQGNIVIFDEAHNVERMCEDSTSCEISSTDIAGAIRDIQELSAKLMDLIGQDDMTADSNTDLDIGADINLKEVLELKAMLHHIEETLDRIEVRTDEGIVKPGYYIFEILSNANVNFSTKNQTIELIDKIVQYLTSESSVGFHSKGASLAKFGDALKIIFSREPNENVAISYHQKIVSKHFKVHIAAEKKKDKQKTMDSWFNAASSKFEKKGRVLSYWCFSPGHAMEELQAQGIKCIILTSGTLSPLSSFTAEMGLNFPVQLENPHVIERHQVLVGIVGKGPDNTLLSSAFENRFRDDYQSSLGNAVVNFSRVVPNGLLLFFPSYPVMENCLQNWKNGNIWNRIEQYKPVFVEPKRKPDFQTAMLNFYEKVNDPKLNGAIFAAVCRGKVSEGLDFTDTNGRAVVITGLPYPPRMDPKVKLKMAYLDENKVTNPKGLSSFDWYKQQATRAVNQAIGRVIRHKQDYGAIILCDNRFSNSDTKSQLPSWVRPYIINYSKFGLALKDLMMFFKTAEKLLPIPQFGKTKIKALSSCEGAHFVPTISRVSSASGSRTNASQVEHHVPSIRPPKTQDISALKEQYGGLEVKSQAKSGLFDMLDADTDTNRKTPSPVDFTGILGDAKNTQADPKNKKKKIQIQGGTDAKPNVTKDASQSGEGYASEVKKILSQEGYKIFSKMVSQYKRTGDYAAMITVLANLFTDSPNNYYLFRKFYKFIRNCDKAKFNQTCLELTSKSCTAQSSDTISKKRPLNSVDDHPLGKKLKQDQQFPVKKLEKAVEKSSSIELNKDTKPSESVLKNVENGISPNDGKNSSAINDPPKKVPKPKEFMRSMGYTCCLCHNDAETPLKAPCLHVCCIICWKEHLREKKQCPQCNQVVKRKNLTRIFFPSGPNL